MSGLQDYYNSVSAYSSNTDSVNSFLSNYDDTFYSNFNDKVNEVKEQGKALVEAGGAVEGVYVGFKGVQKGVQAWRSKYGKKSGGDGDETGGGDDSNAGGGTEGETSGGLEEAGFTEEDAAGLFPDEAAPAGGGGGAPAGGGGDPDPIEGADPDAPFPDAPEVPEPFPDLQRHHPRIGGLARCVECRRTPSTRWCRMCITALHGVCVMALSCVCVCVCWCVC